MTWEWFRSALESEGVTAEQAGHAHLRYALEAKQPFMLRFSQGTLWSVVIDDMRSLGLTPYEAFQIVIRLGELAVGAADRLKARREAEPKDGA